MVQSRALSRWILNISDGDHKFSGNCPTAWPPSRGKSFFCLVWISLYFKLCLQSSPPVTMKSLIPSSCKSPHKYWGVDVMWPQSLLASMMSCCLLFTGQVLQPLASLGSFCWTHSRLLMYFLSQTGHWKAMYYVSIVCLWHNGTFLKIVFVLLSQPYSECLHLKPIKMPQHSKR